MAATLPITGSPLEVSTDPVDVGDGNGPGHAQRMKLLDGTNGGTTPLAVDANGALREPCSVISFTGLPTIGEAGGYTVGQAVGDPIDLGVLPFAGVTRHLEFSIASLAGLTLPALDVFLIQTSAEAEIADLGYLDADAFAPPLLGAGFALGSNASGFDPVDLNPLLLRWSEAHTRQADIGGPPRWFLTIRAGETFADDLTAGLVVFGFAELVRSAALEFTP